LPPRPQADNTDAEEGTIAHDAAMSLLQGKDIEVGGPITLDILHAARTYADYVLSFASVPLLIEVHLQMPNIHSEASGTMDAGYYDPVTRTVHVFDFKYGFKRVEVFQNPQLLCYASGFSSLVGIEKIDYFHLHVVQPRLFASKPASSWRFEAPLLRAHESRLRDAAYAALSPVAYCKSGAWCYMCPARFTCAAALNAGLTLFEASCQNTPDDPGNEEISYRLTVVKRALKQLEYLQSGLEAEVEYRLNEGQVIPGFEMVAKQGRREWIKPVDEVLHMGELMGVDLRSAVKPISPAQAEKAGIPAHLVKCYAKSTHTGKKLTQLTETSIRKKFNV